MDVTNHKMSFRAQTAHVMIFASQILTRACLKEKGSGCIGCMWVHRRCPGEWKTPSNNNNNNDSIFINSSQWGACQVDFWNLDVGAQPDVNTRNHLPVSRWLTKFLGRGCCDTQQPPLCRLCPREEGFLHADNVLRAVRRKDLFTTILWIHCDWLTHYTRD